MITEEAELSLTQKSPFPITRNIQTQPPANKQGIRIGFTIVYVLTIS